MSLSGENWNKFLKRAQESSAKRARAVNNAKKASREALKAALEEARIWNAWERRHGKNKK